MLPGPSILVCLVLLAGSVVMIELVLLVRINQVGERDVAEDVKTCADNDQRQWPEKSSAGPEARFVCQSVFVNHG